MALLFALLVALTFASCARDKYWIPGLTLPPGAVVVDATETKTQHRAAGAAPAKSIRRSLSVSFNCPGGWDAVLAHIEPCLTQEGYHDASASFGQRRGAADGEEGLEELDPVMRDPDAAPGAQAGQDWASLVRLYERPGGNYSVMLQNMAALMGSYASQDSPPSSAANLGLGEYTLYIYEK